MFDSGEAAPLLNFFSSYATAYQQAMGMVTAQTMGTPTWLTALRSPNIPDTSQKQFIIQYQPSQPTGKGSFGGLTPLPPGDQPVIGFPTLNPADYPPLPPVQTQIPNTLLFDIWLAPNTNAVPQRVAYTATPRQTIEQTALGYHVNEFGFAPGHLDIDAYIVYQGMEYVQVDQFFSFLYKVKTVNPLSQVNKPGEVLFIDTYLQRKLSISIENLMVEEVAGANNLAHVVMGAAILYNYSEALAGITTQSGLPGASALVTASSVLGSVLDFVGVSI